ncbi:hypothetical protein LA303_08880 [Candidatus Sulfidibacterium hydrothermale]|uniref:hypothetical protein n=1 Tax=Candidatus Sulfidibacterium hydrothermale TaxID=2875962 RepID=UPI001F0B368D|nr:hypothetical protein [Candidatus Sulfidibacterium hydrothermale]UBM61529.1 hypothetical protein LA303_08880 [Candidatus Sulfidibacterium hydrothermale]
MKNLKNAITMLILLSTLISCIEKGDKQDKLNKNWINNEKKIIPRKHETLKVKKSNGLKNNDKKLKSNTNNKYVIKENYPFLYIYNNNKIIKKINLPSSDEVKNFEYKGLVNTDKGFNILFEWGGFNFSHQNNFVFNNKYLNKIEIKIYNNLEKKIIKDSILFSNPISIKNFDLKKIYKKYNNKL